MEFDAKKIVQDIFKDMCSGGTLVDFNPAQAMIIDGTSIFGDTKSWYLHNKEENMEKKKMTKAEAFGWLDGKKIRTEGNHEKVLRKLFDLGFVWKNLRDTRVDLGWQSGEVYGLTISDDEVAWWTTPHLFDTHGAEQVSADDILSIEIVEEDNEDKPKMFSDYVAIIQSQLEDDEVVIITKKNFMTMVVGDEEV